MTGGHRTWFTADTHFGHDNIIRYCKRPFQDAAEMDGMMIAAWNAVVQPDDTVWHLGDFAFRSARAPMDLLRRLHGVKHLVWGNHDGADCRAAPGRASSQPYAETAFEGQRLVLFHYACRVWHGCGRGAIQLYGHSHGRLPGNSLSLDVGVDAWDFQPVSLADIRRRLRTLPAFAPEDHHGQ